MRVTNNTDSALGVQGVSIPAGQSRNVKGLDLEDEKVAARLEAGDISIPGYGFGLTSEESGDIMSGEDEEAPGEDDGEVPDSVRKRLFGG